MDQCVSPLFLCVSLKKALHLVIQRLKEKESRLFVVSLTWILCSLGKVRRKATDSSDRKKYGRIVEQHDILSASIIIAITHLINKKYVGNSNICCVEQKHCFVNIEVSNCLY